MRVALDPDQPGPRQFARDLDPFLGQRKVECRALSVEAVGVVQHRIGAGHFKLAGPDHLHRRLKDAVLLVEHRDLVGRAPGLAFGHFLQVHDGILDALAGAYADLWFIAWTAADFAVLGGDDLADRDGALEGDLAFDLAAAADGRDFIGKGGDAEQAEHCQLHAASVAKKETHDVSPPLSAMRCALLVIPPGHARRSRTLLVLAEA
ncbi:hypothetical protein D3C72_1552530 [compost metagenome]